MTTTVVTTYTAANTVGSELSHHTMLDETTPSTPTTGAMRDGFFLWAVVRASSVIMEAQGPELPWGTVQTGDRVFGRAFDSAGNAGAWVSYTYTVTETWDFTYYIDPTTGSDSDDGYSEGNAKATWAGAWAQHLTDRGANEKAQFLLKRGETFASTGISTVGWITLGAYVGHIKVGTYGAGAKPHLDIESSSAGNGYNFIAGTLGGCSVTVDSIAFDGQTSTGSGTVVQMPNDPESGSTEAGLLFLDCDIQRMNGVFIGHGPDAGTSYAFKNRADFVLIQDCTVADYSAHASAPEALFAGYSTFAYGGLVRNTFGLCGTANGFARGHRWRHVGIINNTWDRSSSPDVTGGKGNTMRLGGGGDTDADDCAHHINVYGNNFIGVGEGVELEHTNNANQWSWQDIWIHGNRFTMDVTSASLGNPIAMGGGGGGSPDYSARLTRIRIEANAAYSAYPIVGISALDPSTGGGQIESVRIAHNTVVLASQGTMFLSIATTAFGDSAYVDDGSLTVLNNYGWSAGTGFSSYAFIVHDPAWFAASDYNHFRQNSAGGTNWNAGGATNSLAAFQGLGLDTNSSEGFTATHLLTNVTFAAFDPTPTASLFAAGYDGSPGAVLFDFAGNLFDAAEPDAGAIQFGGVAITDPDLGGAPASGVVSSYRSLALGPSIGL